MELFGIILSIPAAFVASVVYCLVLAKFIARINPLAHVLWIASVGVLLLFGMEIGLLLTVGAVQSRGYVGPGFYVVHLVVFFLGTPALANILILRKRPFRWYWAVPACTIFAFALVLLQYGVSEALYGVDGTDGPYSRLTVPRSTISLPSTSITTLRSNTRLHPSAAVQDVAGVNHSSGRRG